MFAVSARSQLTPLLLALGLLTACPEPPPSTGTPQAGTAGGAPGQGGPAGGPGAGQAGPGGQQMGPPPTPATPQFTQEELAGQTDTVTFSGTISCDGGKGPFVIHVFPPPPSDPSAQSADSKPPGPVTELKVAEAGAWSLKVPKGEGVVLLAFADSNSDGMPGPDEGIFFHNNSQPVTRDGDKTGLGLDCTAVATPPEGGTPSGPPPGQDGGPTAAPGGATGAAAGSAPGGATEAAPAAGK